MIPADVREQIEALREEARTQMLTADPLGDPLTRPMAAAAFHAYGKVLRLLDEHDAADSAERAASVEAAAGGQQY